jgi:crotonobetainyl-CoA:carnitine CoA-transferase CaiB-like acyl-CoA transferase
MRRPDLADDPRFLTPELRLRHLDELHQIVQQWIWTFRDMAALDAQMDEAKIATGRVRDLKDMAETDWAADWEAVRVVSDRADGHIRIPGRPWHFSDAEQDGDAEEQFVAKQGEHNREVLAELGLSAAEIAELEIRGALVQPSKVAAGAAEVEIMSS